MGLEIYFFGRRGIYEKLRPKSVIYGVSKLFYIYISTYLVKKRDPKNISHEFKDLVVPRHYPTLWQTATWASGIFQKNFQTIFFINILMFCFYGCVWLFCKL